MCQCGSNESGIHKQSVFLERLAVEQGLGFELGEFCPCGRPGALSTFSLPSPLGFRSFSLGFLFEFSASAFDECDLWGGKSQTFRNLWGGREVKRPMLPNFTGRQWRGFKQDRRCARQWCAVP